MPCIVRGKKIYLETITIFILEGAIIVTKKLLIALILLIILALSLMIYSPNYVNNSDPSILKGTYICDQLPKDSIAFYEEDNYRFYYYDNHTSYDTLIDKGHYSKESNGIYIINSEYFNNEKVTCYKNEFEITIDNNKYIFKRISKIPTLLGEYNDSRSN